MNVINTFTALSLEMQIAVVLVAALIVMGLEDLVHRAYLRKSKKQAADHEDNYFDKVTRFYNEI